MCIRDRVYDLAIRRELIALGQEISARAQSIKLDEQPEEQIILAEQNLYKIGDSGKSETGFKSFLKALNEAVQVANAAHHRDGNLAGISTGFIDLDKKMGGLHSSDLIILAGRPSMGKTSLAMNIVENIVLKQNVPVGVFSLEMTAESLITRMICSHARLNFKHLRDGMLNGNDFQRITQTAGNLHKAPLFVDDTPGLSILQLRAKARRMYSQYGIKLIVIDYLQLLHSTSRRATDNRQQEVAEISSGIKSLAKELSVPIVVLCQLTVSYTHLTLPTKA